MGTYDEMEISSCFGVSDEEIPKERSWRFIEMSSTTEGARTVWFGPLPLVGCVDG